MDSSRELVDVLNVDLPQLLHQRSDHGHLTLVVVDSVAAFQPMDRACSLHPASPKPPGAAHAPMCGAPGRAYSGFVGTNMSAQAPEEAWTPQRVHAELAQATKALLRHPCMVMLAYRAATELTDGLLQARQTLPTTWQARLLELHTRTCRSTCCTYMHLRLVVCA